MREQPSGVGVDEVSGSEQAVLWDQPPETREWESWTDREVRALKLFGDKKPRLADEASAELGWDFMYGRPAVSILHRQGALRETGKRRKARSRSAAELEITLKGLAMLRLLGDQRGAA
jgi:hypothetical protein